MGRKCPAAKVDFPQAAGPQSTTTDGRVNRIVLALLSSRITFGSVVMVVIREWNDKSERAPAPKLAVCLSPWSRQLYAACACV